MRLWRRSYELVLGTAQITDARVSFRVMKNLGAEPNTAEIKVWNLSKDSRALLKNGVSVALSAGYADSIGRIYLGDMRVVNHEKSGADMITTISLGDGERATRTARCNISMDSGASFSSVVQQLADSIGIAAGDAVKKLKEGEIRGAIDTFFGGAVISGNAYTELQRVLQATGLEASVQDGVLQVTEKGQPTAHTMIELSSSTGLVGSPQIGENKKAGIVSATSLLQPGLFPGRKVKLVSESVNGNFRIESAVFIGDTHGNDWYTQIEARPL